MDIINATPKVVDQNGCLLPWWVDFAVESGYCKSEFDINHLLACWGGRMDEHAAIEFKTEQQLTMFILKWS